MKIKELIKSFNKIKIKSDSDLLGNKEYTDENEELKMIEGTKIEKEIVVAATKDIEADNYLINNPVSFYCLNLPSIMSGNINLWSGGRNSIGYQDENGVKAKGYVYNHVLLLKHILHLPINQSKIIKILWYNIIQAKLVLSSQVALQRTNLIRKDQLCLNDIVMYI